jgi:hypothetical protein
MISIPEDYIIHDIRTAKDFRNLTISGYKKADVINAYQNSMINNKLEEAVRWGCELHASGLEKKIWDSLYLLITKYIHLNNPKFFIYYVKRLKDYKKIIKSFPSKNYELFSRNNQEIRNMIGELTSISCITKKNNLFLPNSLPKLGKNFFETCELKKRMLSAGLNEMIDFFYNSTSKEMRLAINEIYINLISKKGTFDNLLYWYIWLEKMENIRKRDEGLENDDKNILIDELWVMIIWKVINTYKKRLDNNSVIYIDKIYEMYIDNFKANQIMKKKYLIFMAFLFFRKNINLSVNLYPSEHLIIQVNGNINRMYERIINQNEGELSHDDKAKLMNRFYQLTYNNDNKTNNNNDNKSKNKEPQKVKKNGLNEIINQITFDSDLTDISKKTNNNLISLEDVDYEEKVVSNVYTKQDIINAKEDKMNKKIDAFNNLVFYRSNRENVLHKNDVNDLSDNIIEFKKIELSKKNR